MSARKILVLGAGELGEAILSALAVHPNVLDGATRLAVLLRPSSIASTEPTKSQLIESLRAKSVQFVPYDLASASADSLSATFASGQFDTIIGATGFAATQGHSLQLKIAEAVVRSPCVRRYVPWQFGIEYDLIDARAGNGLFADQKDVRSFLRANENKVDWVIISTGIFMSFLFEEYWGVVTKGGRKVRALGGWDTQVTVTTAQDIGTVTARIVFDETIKNQVVYIAGDTISYGRLAEVLGAEECDSSWTLEQLQQELDENPDDSLAKYRRVFGEGVGTSWGLEKTYNFQHGIPTTDIEAWVRENNSRFGKAA